MPFPLVLVGWTVVVWTTRIRNVAEAGEGAGSYVVPVGMTLLAVAALVDRRRGTWALAAATIGVWAVRVPIVLARDHGAAFKIVHLVLALVSWALAFLALRAQATSQNASS